ncbi:hypothetical protein [Candidatus Poriferisodalis sp.]|uniref:hypothetical protein n=1 Tax=Candidatus Poriferisodalis sp. TaxID=3101277 RepID=UPI003B011141
MSEQNEGAVERSTQAPLHADIQLFATGDRTSRRTILHLFSRGLHQISVPVRSSDQYPNIVIAFNNCLRDFTWLGPTDKKQTSAEEWSVTDTPSGDTISLDDSQLIEQRYEFRNPV